ncbi:MAG: hypothetical protein JNK02_07480 [Planctomycetes bacterium]|nr:hypothetical protein [Planctomycetota bacterium]
MSTPRPSGAQRRPAFLTPREEPPFWRTPEFTRFMAIALVALGGAAAFLYSQRPIAAPPVPAAGVASPVPATATLSPEARAERESALAAAFEGALRDQADGEPLQHTTGSRKLLEHVARFDPEDFTARVEARLDYMTAIRDPEAWRGRFVRIAGLVGQIWPEKLARPVLGRDSSWKGQLGSGEEFGEPSLLEFLERPFPQVALRDLEKRPVEIEGIFYRMVTFDSEYVNPKGETVEATWEMPWIFVRNIRLLDEGPGPARTFLNDHPALIMGVLAFVIFGGRLLTSWIGSRRRGQRRPAPASTSIREMFDRKLRERGLPPAPPSPPQS